MIKIRIDIQKIMLNCAILLLLFVVIFSVLSTVKAYKTAKTTAIADTVYGFTPEETEPVTEEIEPVTIIPETELEKYSALNSDFTGFIYIPDTEISYPVVKGNDNTFYLYHSFEKERNYVGCPFIDYRAKPEDRNTVIHGHNMGYNQSAVFSTLVNFQDEAYLNEHEWLYYAEPGIEHQRYKIFSVFNFDTNTLNTFDYMQRSFETDESYLTWLSYLKSSSMFEIEIELTKDSQIVILSTCNTVYGSNNRLLVCAVKY